MFAYLDVYTRMLRQMQYPPSPSPLAQIPRISQCMIYEFMLTPIPSIPPFTNYSNQKFYWLISVAEIASRANCALFAVMCFRNHLFDYLAVFRIIRCTCKFLYTYWNPCSRSSHCISKPNRCMLCTNASNIMQAYVTILLPMPKTVDSSNIRKLPIKNLAPIYKSSFVEDIFGTISTKYFFVVVLELQINKLK